MNMILIIDDNSELCVLIKQSIIQEHIEADYCHSGNAGLVKLKENDYQLIILDVMMPGIDGFETLKQIRKETSTITLIAGYTMERERTDDTLKNLLTIPRFFSPVAYRKNTYHWLDCCSLGNH